MCCIKITVIFLHWQVEAVLHVSYIFMLLFLFMQWNQLGRINHKHELDITQPTPPIFVITYTHTHFGPGPPNTIAMAITLSLDWVAGGMLPGLLCQQQEMQFAALLVIPSLTSSQERHTLFPHMHTHTQTCLVSRCIKTQNIQVQVLPLR